MTAPPGSKLGLWDPWVIVLMIAGPWQAFFYTEHPSSSVVYWSLANLALAPIVAFVLLAVHSVVIVVAARLVGDKAVNITIGAGPQLWPRASRASRVTIRLLPVHVSHVAATRSAQGQRKRLAIAETAAIAVFGAIITVVVALEPSPWSAVKYAFGTRLAPDALVVPYAFLPLGISAMRLLTLGRSVASNQPALKAGRVLGALQFAAEAFDRRDFRTTLELTGRGIEEMPTLDLLQAIRAGALVMLRDPTALASLESLKQRALTEPARKLVLALWSWEAYMRDDTSLRDEAHALSEQALRAEPDDLSRLDTHAHMLLWLGRDSSAAAAFERVEAAPSTPSNRSSAACGLAILSARRGDYAAARRWLARAREHDRENMMLPRASAVVENPGAERL